MHTNLTQAQNALINIFKTCSTITKNTPNLYRGASTLNSIPVYPNGHWFEDDFTKARQYAVWGSGANNSNTMCRFVDTVGVNNNLKLLELKQSMFTINQTIYPSLMGNLHVLHQTLAKDIKVAFNLLSLNQLDGIYMTKTNEYFILDPQTSLTLINTVIV